MFFHFNAQDMVDCLYWCTGTLRRTIPVVLINGILLFGAWGLWPCPGREGQWDWEERKRVGGLTLTEHLPFARMTLSLSQCRVCAPRELHHLVGENWSSETLMNILKVLNLISYKGDIWIWCPMLLVLPRACSNKAEPPETRFLPQTHMHAAPQWRQQSSSPVQWCLWGNEERKQKGRHRLICFY